MSVIKIRHRSLTIISLLVVMLLVSSCAALDVFNSGWSLISTGATLALLQRIPTRSDLVPAAAYSRYIPFRSKGYTGFTPDGFPFIGSPTAPVVIEQFSSFSCPFCRAYFQTTFLSILDKIQAGKVQFVYYPLPFIGEFDSTPETLAALCIGKQGYFWEMVETLFDWQTRFQAGGNDAARLRTAAADLKINLADYDKCLKDPATQQILDKAKVVFNDRKLTGTPTIFFNGVQIQPALNGKTTPTLAELRGMIDAAGK